MNPREPTNDGEVLARALEAGAEGRRALERDRPDLVEQLDALRTFEERLDGVAAETRELSAEAERNVTARDRARAREFLAERSLAARKSPRSSRWLVLAAASALVVVTAVSLWLANRNDDPTGRVLLGANGVELRSPSEPGSLAWEAVLPPGGSYRVRVERVAPLHGATEPLFERIQTEARWIPTDEQRSSWPDRVRVEITVLDAAGQDTRWYASLELSLSVSPPR